MQSGSSRYGELVRNFDASSEGATDRCSRREVGGWGPRMAFFTGTVDRGISAIDTRFDDRLETPSEMNEHRKLYKRLG
jgi:hypothetical protein